MIQDIQSSVDLNKEYKKSNVSNGQIPNNGDLISSIKQSNQKALSYHEDDDSEKSEKHGEKLALSYSINPMIKRNNRIFGVCLCLLQILVCSLYGPLYTVIQRNQNNVLSYQQMVAPLLLICLAILLIFLGFGLLFSYVKKLVWSSLGFTLLIFCMSFELYFLWNDLATRINLSGTIIKNFGTIPQQNYIFLWNGFIQRPLNSNEMDNLEYLTYRATLTEAIKCALAMVVAYSSVLGKAGPLEALIMSLIGTMGYSINTHILGNFGLDFGSTFGIFTFGGFMGLGVGVSSIVIKYSKRNKTKKSPLYTANLTSSSLSMLGSLIIFALLPVIVLDPTQLYYQNHNNQMLYSIFSIYYSISAAAITSIGVSIFFNDKIQVRDMINSLVAGGIASLSSVYYILDPWYSLLVGFVSGFIQSLMHNLVQKKYSRTSNIFNTFSLTLFGIQGLVAAIFVSIFQAVFDQNSPYIQASGLFQYLISVGTGLLCGALAGGICGMLGVHRKADHFNDMAYFFDEETQGNMKKKILMRHLQKQQLPNYI